MNFVFKKNQDVSSFVPSEETLKDSHIDENCLKKYSLQEDLKVKTKINCFKQIGWYDPFPQEIANQI